MVNKQRLLNTFLTLVKINSPSLKEKDINIFLRNYFQNIASGLSEDNAAKKINGQSGNLIIKIKGTSSVPPISFWTHMDTVAPTLNIKPILTNNKIKTDGSTILGGDDKAGIAALCEVGTILKKENIPHGDIEFVFTVAEEIGLLGAKNMDFKMLDSKIAYVLDCDGPIGTVVVRAPFSKKIYVKIKGKAAHAGIEPQKGISAIKIASLAMTKIKVGKINQITTANIGKISGGVATNIIPEEVYLEGEVRSFSKEQLNTQVQHMKKHFLLAAKRLNGKVSFKAKHDYSGFSIKNSSSALKLVKKAANNLGLKQLNKASGGGSDANIINKNQVVALNLGVGMSNAHTKKECISKKDLYNTAKLVLEIIKISTLK